MQPGWSGCYLSVVLCTERWLGEQRGEGIQEEEIVCVKAQRHVIVSVPVSSLQRKICGGEEGGSWDEKGTRRQDGEVGRTRK